MIMPAGALGVPKHPRNREIVRSESLEKNTTLVWRDLAGEDERSLRQGPPVQLYVLNISIIYTTIESQGDPTLTAYHLVRLGFSL